LVERAALELRLAQQTHWYHLLDSEMENLRAVLRWSLDEGDVTVGARLAGALTLFWFGSGYHAEGHQWTEELLSHLNEIPIWYQAKLLICAGGITEMYDQDRANRYYAQAVQISRDLGNDEDLAWALVYSGFGLVKEPSKALAITEEALALYQKLNDKAGIAKA